MSSISKPQGKRIGAGRLKRIKKRIKDWTDKQEDEETNNKHISIEREITMCQIAE